MNIHEINRLSPEEHALLQKQLKRQVAKNILAFIALKLAIYGSIAFFAKKARNLDH